MSNEMEQSAQKRIKELQTTAERYRDIVEDHPDFIVRWKPDGTRTFVNEAYCRYWDITTEQALAKNFLFHTTEENRPAMEEIVSRLDAGETEIESETYQLTKPDGGMVWHEWIDQAIRDEWGKLIEIQSVGRDITERKRAQEKLNS
jgi:PAS domain S-box-containing protein